MKSTIALFLLVSSQAMAGTAKCPGPAHTVHTIATNKAATCVLAKLYEPAAFCLADGNDNEIAGVPFKVTPGQLAQFQMSFNDQADFNMEYALTCVVDDGNYVQSPKLVFSIGADGAADPDIPVVKLYGADGSWVATDKGEDYTLKF